MTKYFLNLLLSGFHVSTKHLHPTLGKKEREGADPHFKEGKENLSEMMNIIITLIVMIISYIYVYQITK